MEDRALREAWRRKHAREAAPWAGPVHAAPLLEGMGPRVVELGAGGGKVGRALPPGVVALDWAPEGLRDGDRARVVGDVRRLPFRDGSLDGLVALHVLGHLREADRARAIDEWSRVLRRGGVLVVEVFAVGDARDGEGEAVEPSTFLRGGIPTHHFTEGELAALLHPFRGEVAAEARTLRWGTRRVLRGRFVR